MMEWSIHPSAQHEHDEWIEYFGGIDEEIVIGFAPTRNSITSAVARSAV
jgi:hypothetical protein